ncbi:MAG: Acetyltransferase protein, partial [Gemmatimonadetes bacterium]|nr:Acetyltransferase protein [Gemmatimonadota bacterium]
MPGGFFAVPASKEAVAELSALLPVNVFATAEYFAARRQLHDTAWVLGTRAPDGALLCGAGAFLRKGRINTTMEVMSLPALDASDAFWGGVREFCAQQGVT